MMKMLINFKGLIQLFKKNKQKIMLTLRIIIPIMFLIIAIVNISFLYQIINVYKGVLSPTTTYSQELNMLLNKSLINGQSLANSMSFENLYYNATQSEIESNGHIIGSLLTNLWHFSLYIVIMFLFYALSVWIYRDITTRNSLAYLVLIVEVIFIILLFIILLFYFLYPVIITNSETILVVLTRALPLDYIGSIIDGTIFIFDISLVVIEFLIGHILDIEISKPMLCYDKFLEKSAKFFALMTKVSVIIVIPFSILLGIMAYYYVLYSIGFITLTLTLISIPIAFALPSIAIYSILYINYLIYL